ncbi:MAG TPA: tryptophan dimethylallyltransferase family protein [Leptolyngbyaceae cyanobacterium]
MNSFDYRLNKAADSFALSYSKDDGTRPVSITTFYMHRLEALCISAGFGDATANVLNTFESLVSDWDEAAINGETGWVSDISDDNTPIEFSVVISEGRVQVRVLLEAPGEEPTLISYRAAALAFTERIECEFGADLTRFRKIQDIFLPEKMQGKFALWHSVVFDREQPPQFKAYFNPQALGETRAQSLTEKALHRLGIDYAWSSICQTAQRGPYLDELKYFALDLTNDEKARVKVYIRHHNASADEIESACRVAENYTPGEVSNFVRTMSANQDCLTERAMFTCSAFIESKLKPTAITVYVPVCAYAQNDAVVYQRVYEYLKHHKIAPDTYDSLISGYANRPLDAGVGMQSWIAFRRQNVAQLTIYLASETRKVYPNGSIPAPTPNPYVFNSVESVIRCAAAYDLSEHPYICRLLREENNSAGIWQLVRNTYEGTSKYFVRWLAMVTARVEDDRIRTLLARQLNEELGNGDIDQAHSFLMISFLEALDTLRPPDFDESRLDSGRLLGVKLAKHYMSEDGLEGLGALMEGEICASQMISAVGQLLKTQPYQLDRNKMRWLTQHNEVEGDHAEESIILARLVPDTPSNIESIYRGVMGVHTALWRSLDELYIDNFRAEI